MMTTMCQLLVATSAGSILDISKYRNTWERSISILHGIAILRYIEYRSISIDHTILGKLVQSGISSFDTSILEDRHGS